LGYLVLANISGKADSSSLANVALTGSYEDLIDVPTIPTVPTNISSFTNDLGYLVLANISGKADSSSLANVALTGSYDDLTNTPTIPTVPTNVSEFTNDAGYLVLANISGKADSSSLANVALTGSYEDLIDVPTNISSFTNDAGYAVESNVNLTITELGNTLSNSIGNIQSNVSTIDSTLGTLNNTVSGIITALDEGPIDVTGNISATNIFTDNLFYANGDPYITSGVSDTGNIRFSGDTITNAENEEDRGIILNASGNGEISLTDNTGINNFTPGYWLHVGSEETTTGNINTGEIAISFSNGQSGVGAYNNTAYLGWNWWDSASQGSFNNGTGVHSKFGIYSGNSSPYSQPFIEFDGNSGDVSVPNSLSILGNFLKLPTFDNSTSRDTLIPTPEAGMMILTGNIFQGYNGSSWVDLNN
jgi:hypothetical protein